MRALQENLQNIQLLIFQKTDEEKKIKITMKTKFKYYTKKIKNISTAIIFSLISTLENIVIWIKKAWNKK